MRPTRLKPASLGLDQTGDDKPKRHGIIGLDYRSNSKSGQTDAQGTFSHGAGETVTFSIGNLDLGATPGKPIATVVDLVEGATGVNNQRVANIARLLQSLDSDCNVRNGIQITSQIRAEVSPRVIDFDQSSIAFGSDPLNDADHSVTVRIDQGRDGSIDQIVVLRYDAAGNCIEEEYDENADGMFDYLDSYEFNAFGQQTGHLFHRYSNGQKYRYTTTYDSGGNVTLEQTDSDDDGTVDYEYRYTYAGSKLTTKQYTFKDVGGVFTWFLDYEETFVFNQNDLYIEQTIVFHDAGGNPDETHRQIVTRDANGNTTRTEWTKPTGETEIQTFIWEEQSIPAEFDIYIPATGPLAFS